MGTSLCVRRVEVVLRSIGLVCKILSSCSGGLVCR